MHDHEEDYDDRIKRTYSGYDITRCKGGWEVISGGVAFRFSSHLEVMDAIDMWTSMRVDVARRAKEDEKGHK